MRALVERDAFERWLEEIDAADQRRWRLACGPGLEDQRRAMDVEDQPPAVDPTACRRRPRAPDVFGSDRTLAGQVVRLDHAGIGLEDGQPMRPFACRGV